MTLLETHLNESGHRLIIIALVFGMEAVKLEKLGVKTEKVHFEGLKNLNKFEFKLEVNSHFNSVLRSFLQVALYNYSIRTSSW